MGSSSFFETEYVNEDLNEFEIIVYRVGDISFAINILKVKEVIHRGSITATPNRHRYVSGTVQFRDEAVPVIELHRVLALEDSLSTGDEKMMVVEVNGQAMVLAVDGVVGIYNINWALVHNTDELSAGLEYLATGYVKMDNETVQFLDYEKIIMEIHDERLDTGLTEKVMYVEERSNQHIVLIEDSVMMLRSIEDFLRASGYTNVTTFKNGQDALTYLLEGDHSNCGLLVTDLEMPGITGHQLTNELRRNSVHQDLPILLFSAMVSENVRERNEQVGVTQQVQKPDVSQLVSVMDEQLHIRPSVL
ncbi:chemotaxis protein CheV [Geomicrobium sp. JCM 19037]|uniref:chemotaxis protein CheV n=1 Tax=Geomicrobium sp. JCM 19037 TaxID=1460634 RepID=UPI00045F3201|nr:chemotaxis protein [Geomicrobium sp. JCM 19037]GAK01947.1 chemotaxis protein CheV [Geomicrobium sp. JCM 19037]